MKTKKFWLTLIGEITFFLVVFSALSYWQEQDLLESNTEVESLTAITLEGKPYTFPTTKMADKTLIYFFAPWCKICHISIGNLNILRSQISAKDLNIIIVALDWKSKAEISDYMKEHDLDFPVLLGDEKWQQKYKIKGFPTYYVLNEKAEVLSKSIGYSSSIGMLRRALL